jgi:hypothetical protein
LLLFLDGRLHQAELTASHRRSATQVILGLCEALAHKNDGQVQAVFNQHHSEEDAQALAEEARAGAEHAKAVFEDLFGKPLHGAYDLHTEEAVFEAGLRKYREQQQRHVKRREHRRPAGAPERQPMDRRQRMQQQRRQQRQQQRHGDPVIEAQQPEQPGRAGQPAWLNCSRFP